VDNCSRLPVRVRRLELPFGRPCKSNSRSSGQLSGQPTRRHSHTPASGAAWIHLSWIISFSSARLANRRLPLLLIFRRLLVACTRCMYKVPFSTTLTLVMDVSAETTGCEGGARWKIQSDHGRADRHIRECPQLLDALRPSAGYALGRLGSG